MKRKAFTMPLNFLFQLIFAVIILVVVFSFIAKPFMAERRTQAKYQDIMMAVQNAYEKFAVGELHNLPLSLGDSDYIALFEKDKTQLFVHQARTNDQHEITSPSGYYLSRPPKPTCEPEKSCLCLCTSSKIGKDGGDITIQGTILFSSQGQMKPYSGEIEHKHLSCDPAKLFCRSFDFNIMGNCTTSSKSIAYSCEGGVLFDRSITAASRDDSRYGLMYFEKPKRDLVVLCRTPPCSALGAAVYQAEANLNNPQQTPQAPTTPTSPPPTTIPPTTNPTPGGTK